jgi:hypothetical protein
MITMAGYREKLDKKRGLRAALICTLYPLKFRINKDEFSTPEHPLLIAA